MRANSIVAVLVAGALAAPVAEPQVLTLSANVPIDTLTATVGVSIALTSSTSGVNTSTTTTPTAPTSSLQTSTTPASTSTTIATTSIAAKQTTTSTSSKKTTSTTSSKRTTSTTSSKRTTSTTSSKKVTSTTSTIKTTSKQTTTTTSSKKTTTSTSSAKLTTTSAISISTTTANVVGTPIVTSRSSTSSAGSVPTTLAGIAVYHHNIHRANHSASDVVWDDNLALIAANIASSCVYAHNVTAGGGGYGQNIAAGVQANNISRVITDLFYNGEVGYYAGLYGQENPDFTNFDRWGHFSQVVWKGTESIGCAVQYCPNGLANTGGNIAPYFTVCNYGPPGNYLGEFGDNVGAPLGQPTAEWDAGLSISIPL